MTNQALSKFSDEAQKSFDFLKRRGFGCISASPRRVRYESQQIFIEISYGSYDCEVAINFGRLGRDEEFSFTGFLRLVNPSLEKRLGDRIAYGPQDVRKDLRNLATALQSEGEAIIKGEDSLFDRMKDVRWWDFEPDALLDQGNDEVQ